MVEAVIAHVIDDASLGEVNFKPYLCAAPLASVETTNLRASIYPNPSNGNFTLSSEQAGSVVITDVSGKIIYTGQVAKGKNTVSVNATAGVYFMLYQAEGKRQTMKLIIK